MNKKTKTVKMKNYVCVRDHLKLEQNSFGRKEKNKTENLQLLTATNPRGVNHQITKIIIIKEKL